MKKPLLISILIGVLLLIQFIRIDTSVPEINMDKDYLSMNNAPIEIITILQNSCYDCHSNQTNYPWYSKIAPVSWMLKSHVNEGREHLNLSNFGDYSLEEKNSIQKECIEEIEENKMPLKSYTFIHANARLSDDTKQSLINFLRLSIQKNETQNIKHEIE